MQSSKFFSAENALNLSGVLVSALVCGVTFYIMGDDPRLFAVMALSLISLTCFCLFVSPWTSRTPRRQQILLWLQAACILPLYFLVSSAFISILGIVWVVQVAEVYNVRRAAWLTACAILAFAASQLFHYADVDIVGAIFSALTLGLFKVFALSATWRAIREQQLRQQTAGLNRELLATRELLSQSVRHNERLRIARDLHDLLGHHMTALILNLEVAKHHADGLAQQKVEQSLALAKLLLSDIRTAVSELRDEEAIDLRLSLEKLIAEVPGIRFELDIADDVRINDVKTAETLLRCAQEAITNVLRHSRASHCTITIVRDKGIFALTVTDNGDSNESVLPGNGLKGMMERIQDGGGTVNWQNATSGFVLNVRLPAGTTT